jgi:hypothetical protein
MSFTQKDYEKLQPLPSGAYWRLALSTSDSTMSDRCSAPCSYIFTARARDGSCLPYQAVMTFVKSGTRHTGKTRYYADIAPDRSFLTVEKMLLAKKWSGRRRANTKHNAPVDILSIAM